ncbi:hypothetical protein Tco_0827726 [Tanacetum coccineum]
MTVDNVTFQTNNVVGNFNYPPNVPGYKLIMKFLLNCPLKKAFTNCPSVVYQNFLREFWSTAVAYDPFPSTDETEQRPLREFLIKFSVLNGQRPLTLDFNTFCSSTGLDYNNGKYVAHPTPEAVKKELGKIAINPNPEVPGALSKKIKRPKSKKPPTETKSTGLSSTLDEGTRKSKPLPESTATPPKDSRGNIQPLDRDITSTTSNEGTAKTTSRPEGSLGNKDSGGNMRPADMELIHPTVVDLSGTGAKYQVDQTQSTRLRHQSLPENKGKPSHEGELDTQPIVLSTYADVRAFLLSDDESEEDILGAGEEMNEEPQVAGITKTHHQSPPPQADKPQSSHAPFTKASNTDSSSDNILKKYDNTLPLTERQLEKHEEAAVNYADLKASIDDYYDENIAHRDQIDKLVEASMSPLDKSSNTINDLYKGLNIITELLKEIKNVVKDDSVIKKISKATESFTKFSTNITDLKSFMNTLQAHALKQDEELSAWAKSSTNMAWNLGSRLSGLKRAQNHIQSSMSSLMEDTHSIKNMMTKMYEIFKGQSSGSVTPTLALTHIPANVEGENATNTATEEPPSHTEGDWRTKNSTSRIDKGKGIATKSKEDSLKKLVSTSTIAQMDKEELIKKDEEEARRFAISKPEVIKVVQEESKKIRLDLKKIASAKVGKKFKKAQDAEHQVLKREHTEKVKKSLELKKHKFENYMWTINNILKPETITDIRIHPKTKPVVITVYRGTNGRNFDVHKPFAFGAFGISELDKLREIIPKKKNTVSALPAPAPAPEQASSKSSRKKRKHMELEPELKIHRLECNRALPKNVPFINNMVIKEPEYGIFFTDEFGDQAFQR